jgi:hypothetical protein
MNELLMRAVLRTLIEIPESEDPDRNSQCEKVIYAIQKRLGIFQRVKKKTKEIEEIQMRINYPGTSNKPVNEMNAFQFDQYLKAAKKDMTKSFNLAKKSYFFKF